MLGFIEGMRIIMEECARHEGTVREELHPCFACRFYEVSCGIPDTEEELQKTVKIIAQIKAEKETK